MNGCVLIVGAGIAGMRTAAELLQQGFKVYLLEEKPTIGGKMAQIDKMFPTNECATCTELPQMLALTSNPNLTVLAFSSLLAVDGKPGDFTVKVLKKPRYVNPAKCTACTDCFPACPVGNIPMEFNFGKGVSKAISFYSPFPPRKALINPDMCTYIKEGKCGDGETPPCVTACKPEAIDFSQKPQEITIKVGAIVLATGMEEEKGENLKRFGYGKLSNVLTALEYERLLSGLGPTLGMVKRDDGQEPQSVTWLVQNNNSPIGFMSAVSEAIGTLERNPEASVSIIYQHIGQMADAYNKFYLDSKEENINYVKAEVTGVNEATNGNITVSYKGEDGSEKTQETAMLVLNPPLIPATGTGELAEKLNLDWDEKSLFGNKTGDAHPLKTSREGIFVCGDAQKSKGIGTSVVQACSAAANVGALLTEARGTELVSPPERELLAVEPADEPEIAVIICRCGMNIAGLLDIERLSEYVKSLPYVKQVDITPFGCDGAKLKEVIGSGKFNRIVMGACSPKTHESLFQQYTEGAGLNKYLLEIVNLRNQCTWVHSKDKEVATQKAETLMKMGVSRAALQEPLEEITVSINKSCLVVGINAAGLACAKKLSEMGFKVCIADGPQASADDNLLTPVLAELEKSGGAEIYRNTSIGTSEGFIGNYDLELITPAGKKCLNVGCIVIATKESVKAEGTNYESDLGLQRNADGLFEGALGILNQLDFNTDGIFKCGSARASISSIKDLIVDGEAAASRVAGIINKSEMAKAPTISFVIDENCDGCAYCIDPCPARAIKLLEYEINGTTKKTVEVNQAMCKGCGICMATCPKSAIVIKHFESDYFRAMTKAVLGVA